jgi:hypothetical protein
MQPGWLILVTAIAIAVPARVGPVAWNESPGLKKFQHAPLVLKKKPDGTPLNCGNMLCSDNWGGYALTGGPFTQISGTWTVPAAVPGPSNPLDSWSSTWIGIGGAGETTLIQLGTEQNFQNISPPIRNYPLREYYAWTELLPGFPVQLPPQQFPVSPGDVITASINCIASCTPGMTQTWHMTMSNLIKGWNWVSGNVYYASSMASAEWIMETPCPSINGIVECGKAPAPAYGSVGFSNAVVNNVNPRLDLKGIPFQMQDPAGGTSTPCPAEQDRFLIDFGLNCISNRVAFKQPVPKVPLQNSIMGVSPINAVALSGNGNTAIIGVPNDTTSNSGSAWVYTRSGAGWMPMAQLIGSPASPKAQQGFSVALNGTGDLAVIGAPNDNGGVGAVFVFALQNGSWTQKEKIVAGSYLGSNPQQGWSVALARGSTTDSATMVIGGPGDSGNVNIGAGAAWVFTLTSGAWIERAKLVGSGAYGLAGQGRSVATCAHGERVISGGPYDNGWVAAGIGSAWVFVDVNGNWQMEGKLTGSYSTYEEPPVWQGWSVAMDDACTTVLIGAPGNDGGSGATWVFHKHLNEPWIQEGPELIGTGASGVPPRGSQGASVSLSGDGNTAVIGATGDNLGIGATWVFRRDPINFIWAQQGDKLVGTGVTGKTALQGFAVVLTDDNSTLVVAGPADNNGTGAFWEFTQP